MFVKIIFPSLIGRSHIQQVLLLTYMKFTLHRQNTQDYPEAKYLILLFNTQKNQHFAHGDRIEVKCIFQSFLFLFSFGVNTFFLNLQMFCCCCLHFTGDISWRCFHNPGNRSSSTTFQIRPTPGKSLRPLEREPMGKSTKFSTKKMEAKPLWRSSTPYTYEFSSCLDESGPDLLVYPQQSLV